MKAFLLQTLGSKLGSKLHSKLHFERREAIVGDFGTFVGTFIGAFVLWKEPMVDQTRNLRVGLWKKSVVTLLPARVNLAIAKLQLGSAT